MEQQMKQEHKLSHTQRVKYFQIDTTKTCLYRGDLLFVEISF